MAESYPIPNWIRPPNDIAGDYLRGLSIGSQISSEQQRLQQSAATTSAELSMKQQLAEQQHMQEQQRMEIEKSYHQQQIGLQQQELEQKQQVIQLKTQDAARQLQAQTGYQQFVAGGGDPVEGLLKFGPQMGENMAGYGSLAKDVQDRRKPAFVPTELTVGGRQMLQTSPNRYQVIPPEGTMSPLERSMRMNEIGDLERQRNELDRAQEKDQQNYDLALASDNKESTLYKATVDRYENRKKRMAEIDDAIAKIRKQTIGPGAASAPPLTEEPQQKASTNRFRFNANTATIEPLDEDLKKNY
jgi:hypothetical protein